MVKIPNRIVNNIRNITGILIGIPLEKLVNSYYCIFKKQKGKSYDEILPNPDFPIDIVYTWVDGKDPEWKKKRNKILKESSDYPLRSTADYRFHNRDELKYSLRSIDRYKRLFRQIFIVTDRQIPDWLDTNNKKIKVVFHDEIFSNPTALPTFNSHAIETQLHHIKGLSEHFLYFNDDYWREDRIEKLICLSNFYPDHILFSDMLLRCQLKKNKLITLTPFWNKKDIAFIQNNNYILDFKSFMELTSLCIQPLILVEYLKHSGIKQSSFHYWEDNEFVIKLLLSGISMCVCLEGMYYYTKTNDSLSSKSNVIDTAIEILKNLKATNTLNKSQIISVDRRIQKLNESSKYNNYLKLLKKLKIKQFISASVKNPYMFIEFCKRLPKTFFLSIKVKFNMIFFTKKYFS